MLKQRGAAFLTPHATFYSSLQSTSLTRLPRASPLRSNMSNVSSGTSSPKNYNLAQDSSELFDLYDAPPSSSHCNSIITPDWGESYYPCPKPTGRVKERGRVHVDGDWHRSVQIWIAEPSSSSKSGGGVRVLLQRRSPYKDTHPNLLDVSCAGHVNAKDDVLDTALRELEEELGGNGALRGRYTPRDVERGRAFVAAQSVEGETAKYGKFVCREYQDVFILWWEGSPPMTADLFAPLVQEEVSGFEIMDGRELIQRMSDNDPELVPRSKQYVDALARVFGL